MTHPPDFTPEPGWLAGDVARVTARLKEWGHDMTDDSQGATPGAPMTLTEFERAMAACIRLAARRCERSEDVVRYRFRPLILRLRAGERERCKALSGAVPKEPQTAQEIARDTLASIGSTATEVHPHSDIGMLVAGLRRIAEMEPQS